jgi:CHAT domain-containing protein/tetratricopeptide (TPR) repeat protein
MLRANSLRSASASLALCLLLGGAFALTVPQPSGLNKGAQAADETALRSLAEQFFRAFAGKDLAAYLSLWSEKAPDFKSLPRSTQNLFAALDRIEVKNLNVSKVTATQEKGSARLTVEISAIDVKTGQPSAQFGKMNRALQFVREESGWKIWRYLSADEDLAERLNEARTDEERAALLATETELLTPELTKALIALGEKQRGQGNYKQAMATFRYAYDLAQRLGDKAGTASSLNSIGTIYRVQSDYAQALENFQKSLAISKEIESKEGIASSIYFIGIVQEALGNYAQSLEYLRQSLEIREALGDKNAIANLFNSMGIVYYLQGEHNLGLEYFEKALKIKEELNDKAGVANLLNSIGNVYHARGNYALALEVRLRGLALATETGQKPYIATALNNIGNIYSRQGAYDLSLEYYQKSLAMREELGDKTGVVNSLGNIGATYDRMGQYEKAEEIYQRALKLGESLGNKGRLIHILDGMCAVSSYRGNHETALDYCRRALKLSEEIGDKEWVAKLLYSIADEYFILGNYTEARSYAERSAAIAKEVGSTDHIRLSLVALGRIESALNHPPQARKYFEEAIATIESLRSQVAGTGLDQQRFLESKLYPYQALAELLVTANQPADALVYSERAKARVLLGVLQNGRIDVTKAMTIGEREEERKLRVEIVSLNTQVTNESLKAQPEQNRLRDLNLKLDKARLNFETFQAGLYAAHPELRAQRGGAQLVTLEQAGALLGDNKTAMLEYMVTEKKTFLFVLTRDDKQPQAQLRVYTIDIDQKTLGDKAESYRRLLAQRNANFSEPAQQLYQLLLAPARRQLEGKTRLVIVPDGALWNLPFQALESGDAHYLINDYAIDYAPSLTVLRETARLRNRKQPAGDAPATLLAFGNPTIGNQAVERTVFNTRSERLSALPEAETEVKALAQLYSAGQSRVYTRAEAQEERAKSEAGRYRIIHLATHGIINDVSPMYSYLVLSRTEGSNTEDGLLEAWEIMNMNLRADLVVLSACETARGRIGAGEGVIGLSWAFFVAGTPTSLVSQWKVESASTARLMLEFHSNFKAELKSSKQKPSEAEALRQAVLKLQQDERYRHPFYWAGFVVVGDGL